MCWVDEFRKEHERVIQQLYKGETLDSLRESRERWFRTSGMECCRESKLKEKQ